MVQPRSLASAVGGKDQLAEIGNSAHALTNCSAVPVVNSLAFEGKAREAAKRLAVNSQGVSPWEQCARIVYRSSKK